MSHSILDSADNIAWLREVHIRALPASCEFAILYGNEDSPIRVEAYDSAEPLYTDDFTVYERNDDGDLVEVRR